MKPNKSAKPEYTEEEPITHFYSVRREPGTAYFQLMTLTIENGKVSTHINESDTIVGVLDDLKNRVFGPLVFQ